MTLPQCLEPIRKDAMNRGWILGKVPYGSALDSQDGHTKTVLAGSGGDGAYVFHRYHTEADERTAAELSVSVRDALREQNQKDERQRQIAKRAGERRSTRRKRA